MRSANLRAIGTMVLAVGFFSFMDAGLKRLAVSYSTTETTFLRAAASMPFLLGSIAWANAWRRLRVDRPALYVARAALGFLMLWSFIYAVARQPLSDVYVIFMSAPLMVAAVSQFVLGEHVPARRWAAITLGLTGIAFAMKPSASGFISLGGLAAMVAAACYAGSVLAIRIMGRTDSGHALVFWYMLLLTCSAGALAYPDWRAVAPGDWLLIAFVGAVGAVAQHLVTSAFRRAPASMIAPFEYTALLWGLGLDYAVFSIRPVPRVIIGGAIVIAGGLYVIWDERRAAAALTPAAPR